MSNTSRENSETEKTDQEKVYESVKFVVDMMNGGNVDPKEVYPANRYCGD